MIRKKNVELLYYTKLAHRRVKAEQLLLERRINHPELFVSYAHKSELYWGDKFVKRCLLELISALYYIGAVVDKYGKPIEFRPLVRGFESMLNIDLSLAYKERDKLMVRGNKATFFLDFMTERLKEKVRAKKEKINT